MAGQEMSDADVFGAPQPSAELNDEDVFGKPKPSMLDRAKDFAGDFLDAQAHNVAYAEGSSIEHALNANKELYRDFTTPLAKPTEEDREGGQDLALRAVGLPDKVIEATRDIRHEITDPFVPTIEDAAGLASRAAKVGVDFLNVPYQLVVGTGSPAVDLPLGDLRIATDPRYTKEEREAMTVEQRKEKGEELYQNVMQIPFVAEGGLRVPKAHMPPAERFARPPEPLAEPATPTAPPQGPAGAPEAAAPQPAASAPAPAPAASVTPAAYVPQFDLVTNTFHVVGPDGARVGPPAGYARPEQAARAAEELNGRGVTKTVAPVQARQEAEAPAPPPDLMRTLQVGDKTHAVELPDENHAALFDYGQSMERAMAGGEGENLDPSDIYKRFKPWVLDDFASRRDVGDLAQDYMQGIEETIPDADGVIRGHLVVDPDEEANYVRQQRGIAPVRISAPAESMQPVDGQIVSVSPDDLKVDPARFQYKASDDQGVTGDLSGAKKWEPALTNPITVWRDRDSQLWVVNGHQRTDLARRAQAAGQTDIQMPARIYNAADGYTPAYMRALGAIQNMAEGSGSSIDAAKVLRALPDLDEGKSLPMAGLNIARGVAKDAQGLAGLTDHGFGLVTNEIIPPEYAAEVGRRIQDPAQQDAALNTLVKEKPQSAAQARFMVDDMLNSGFLGGEQTNLFGTEQLAQSLFGERSQILDNSIRTLRRNKSVFNAAITGDDTLSGAGNVLDREGNLKGKSENEQLIDHLGQATRKGPLSDALTQAARDLAGGQPVSRVTSSFLAKARQVVKSGYDAESVPAGADIGGNGLARPAEARAVADEPYRPTEADGQSGFFMQRGPGGMPALRAALQSGNIKRGAQAMIDRLRLQAGLDDSNNIRNPDRGRAPVDRADIREVENFIDFIGHHMFTDVGLRILKGGEGGPLGQYNAYNHIVSLFRNAVSSGEVSRTMVHELWHSLERVLPREDYAAVTREFQRQQGKWLGKNEWARPFLQNGVVSDSLTGKRGKDWLEQHRDDPAAMGGVKVLTNDKGQETGVAMRWTNENYRFKNREEYFAETMADKHFRDQDLQDEKARSVVGHAKDIYNRMVDGVKRLFGRDATGRIYEGFREGEYQPGQNPDNPYTGGTYEARRGTTHEGEPEEFDFQREYEKSLERSAHAERLAAEGQPVRFQGENGRTALASPDIGGNGYRLTYFDDRGPIGHTVYNTPAEAIRDGMRYGEPVDRAGKSLLPEGLAENHAGIERTDQGDQYVMPGAERKAVQAAAARGDAMTSTKPQKAADFGLFGKPEPEQAGLFDKPKQEVLPVQDPHQAAADLVKGRGRETGDEHLAAIDGNTGKPIGAVSGADKAYVKVPDALMAKLNDPDESVVIHHNHPSGGALSMADVSMLARPGLDTVIAHTHDGDVSRASLTPSIKEVVRNAANPDAAWSRLSVPFKRAWNSTFTLLQDAVGKGKVTPEEAAQLLHESILRAAHENGLLDYTTTHDISHLPTDVVDAAGDRAAYVMRQAMKGADLATDVRRSPEPVRSDQALAGLPGENGKAAEAAPARGDDGRSAGPVRNQLPDKTGQFALLDSSLREAPEVKELFARSAETLAKSKGPMRAPERVAKVVGKTIADSMMGRLTRRLVSPGSMDASARIASRGIRQVFGQMYVQDMRAANALKAGSDLLDKMTVGERNEFAMAYEEGQPQASPILTAIADNLRQVTKDATARLKSLGILDDAKENYLGRIWKERGKEGGTDQAEKNVLALMSKTPLKGPGTFLKQRFYDTYRNALESGLEPVHSNPVMTQLVKISEMNRYYAGELIRRGAIDSGLAKFYRQGEAPPDLMKLEGAEFQRLGRMVENADGDKTMVRPGAYYAPEGFARVMNNFQSRGLKGTMFGEPAKYLRAVSNAMNMFQLGLSFFHPMFTSQDASISRIAIGVDQAVRGEFGKAGGNIVKGVSPTNWYTNLKDGDKLLKAILDPDVGTPEQQRLANAFGAGGGRVFMQRVLAPTDEGAIKFWKSGEFGRAIQQAAKKYPGSPLRATMNVVGRTLETTTAPIMDYLVPRQKLGVFSRMATDWLGSHPDATNTEFVAAMQDRWESVDNRLGQMVYDNLFWDKTLKDIAFMTTRSVGWNLGSMREIGGGLADTGKFAYNAATLNSPEWTHRMSYLVALTTYTMAQGAMLNYLFTGKGPEEIKDYFYPKTGYMGRNGAPDRIQLPTYAKDVFAYTHDPVKTLRNKSSPLLSFLSQALDGHDYYGDLIANKNDPLLKQFEDVMKFAGSQFMPFSIQGTRRMLQERPGPAGLMGMFGFTPAPGYITNPLAEQKFLNREHKADTTKTRNHMARENIVAPLKPMPPQAHAAGGRVMSRDDHDRAASMADPNPTDPQIEAGNYQKGHLRIHGMDVSIETAKGQVRRGVGKGGKPWKVTMPNHYGYIRGTVGSDSEQVDCFVGFFPRADHVYIIDQVDPDTRVYDEHKVMLNFPNMPTALAAYRRAFSDGKGARRIGNVRAMTIAEFKEWLRDGDTKSSIAA